MGRDRKNILALRKSSLRVKKSVMKRKIQDNVEISQLMEIHEDCEISNQNERESDMDNNQISNLNDSMEIITDATPIDVPVCNDYSINLNLMTAIRQNALKYNTKRTGVTSLLKDLQKTFPFIPGDYRTLLKTPRSTNMIEVAPRNAIYFSIESSISRILQKLSPEFSMDVLQLDLFVDGVQFKKDPNE